VKPILKSFLILLVGLSPTSFAADEWLKDEVLKQLSELRRDNAALRKDVDTLKQRIGGLESGKGKEPPKKLEDILGGKTPLGKESAKIVVAEFTDYQCPFCKKFGLTTFPKLKQEYVDTGKVRYVVRDFPLAFHAEAKSAAVAALCAGQQQRYWEMKTRLFEHQAEYGRALYLRLAGELKLDAGRLGQCLDDPRMAEAVARDVAYGNSLGVQATPTFVIGRIEGGEVKDVKAVSGAMAFEAFAGLLNPMMPPR
jgi:protein-disulfide isomerase